jgi:hypothetical protein
MKKFSLKKKLAAAVGVATIVAGAGVSYAYFTTTGSGSGTGAAGTSSNLTIHQDTITYSNAPANNLVPGTSATVSFKVDNGSSGHQQLGTIKLASWGSDKTGCDSAAASGWITMPDVPVNVDYAPGAGQTVTPTGTITFNNLPAVQDACKGAALTFTYAA